LAGIAERLPVEGGLMRWVHNDAKLDNVLVDDAMGEALCVVDLDTVMPGLAAHDFGDLVRTAVSGCREDEPDLDRITVREGTFRDLAAGYLEGSAGWLTPWDRSRLIDGALVLTYEQALRFLTDYLAGDRYYPVVDPEHNLRRARAQLRLLEVILRLEGDLRSIVDKL
jgi:aminoglycoside phosphotransferase (APT) family kinase protein